MHIRGYLSVVSIGIFPPVRKDGYLSYFVILNLIYQSVHVLYKAFGHSRLMYQRAVVYQEFPTVRNILFYKSV